ncbi:hypothetical protein LUZ60_010281 [Juncus effusus]|nr:hypothetical protein LUZ60_010281 [Juncus effusus]
MSARLTCTFNHPTKFSNHSLYLHSVSPLNLTHLTLTVTWAPLKIFPPSLNSATIPVVLPSSISEEFETVKPSLSRKSIQSSPIFNSPPTPMRNQRAPIIAVFFSVVSLLLGLSPVHGDDHNGVYSPCEDAAVRRGDGFAFGVAFTAYDSFFSGQTQYSPCDSRLGLQSKGAQVAVFRPKVDEISLLTVNSSDFNPANSGGWMVAFAGRKYAARSVPTFVANSSYVVTAFTLVLEFQKGTLQNLYWKTGGCSSCSSSSSSSNLICLDKTTCALKPSACKNQGGQVDCSMGIQVAFSGTDKNEAVLNSWYEVSNMNQYSLFGLYSGLKDSLTSQLGGFF